MLSNEEYLQRWNRKLNAYRNEGILLFSEGGGKNGTLLVTEEKEGSGLDADQININIQIIQGNIKSTTSKLCGSKSKKKKVKGKNNY